jgi:Zn-dependent M28 family amino/carboxypeptidase
MEYLVGLQERRSHENQQQAAAYIASELAKIDGIQLHEHSYSYTGQTWVNLEATLQGSSDPATFVFAGAHFDSASNHPQLAPGADDNASGTAAVLEAARVLASCVPEHSIRLLFFSNEEPGMVGSEAYVESVKGVLPRERLIGFINVDMVAYGPQDEDLDVATRPEHAAFAQQVGQTVEQHTTLKVKSIVSDHCG